MKTAITFLLTLLFFSCFSQELIRDNFYNQGNDIYWQVVDETELTFEELANAVKQSGNYENFDVSENQIICTIKPFICNYKTYGFDKLSARFEIAAYYFAAMAVFEKKDNRVRYTVKNIEMLPNQDYIIPVQSKTTLSDWFNSYKPEFRAESFASYSYILNDEFNILTKFEKPENW